MARYKANWDIVSQKQLKEKYDNVMRLLLTKTPYGEYFALEEIFGAEVAKRVAEGGEVLCPPIGRIEQVGSEKTLGKRKRITYSDSDVEIIE